MLIVWGWPDEDWDWADKDACANNESPNAIKQAPAGANRPAILSRLSAQPDFRIDFINISPRTVLLRTGAVSHRRGKSQPAPAGMLQADPKNKIQ
jgi:hypothetical protein